MVMSTDVKEDSQMKCDGIHCPKCGKRMARSGNHLRCRCGYSYFEPEGNWQKWLGKMFGSYGR